MLFCQIHQLVRMFSCIHQLVRMNFVLSIHQLVRMFSCTHQLIRMNFVHLLILSIHHLVRMFSCIHSARTHEFCFVNPSARTHGFSDSSLCHGFDCIHSLRLDEVHSTFSDQWLMSTTKPQEGVALRDVSRFRVHTGNSHSRLVSSRRLHENRIVSSYLQFSTKFDVFRTPGAVFHFAPLRQVIPSDCFNFDFPNHLGHTLTEAPLSIITNSPSRSA